MKLETIQLSKLNPAEYNPRQITKEEFEGLKESLKTFGQQENLIVNKDMTIISGHQRYEAMKKLGWTEAVCNMVDLDKHQEKKLNVIMNSTAISGKYDDLKLSEILEELKLDDDYESLRLDKLEPLDLSDVEVEEDEAPEVSSEPPVSKLGDIYQLGRHRVMCGDSTDFGQVDTLLEGKRAEMCFTDPPYGVNYEGGHFHSGDVNIKRKREKLAQDDSTQIYSDVVPVIAKYTDGPVYTFYAGTKPTDLYVAVEAVGEIHALLIWHKTNATYAAMNAQYKQRHEPFLYWKPKGSTLRWCGATTEATIWELTKDGKNDMHPTQKPVHLAVKAIQNHTAQTVLDLFLGSGSTLIACEQTDRTCYGMELDEKYVDVIRKRYWKFVTGNEEGWEDGTTNSND